MLAVPEFRRLWIALSLSSFGDWLGLLALTSLAATIAGGDYTKANLAIAGVYILRLAPAVIFGPLAGVVADRLDRRTTMVVADLARFALFLSIPIVGTLWWLLVATFLIEVAAMFWIPAKEASVPNIVPRENLESANQLSLMATYGSAPVAAAAFALLSLLTGILDNAVPFLEAKPVDLALWFDAFTFLVSALTIRSLRSIPRAERAGAGSTSTTRTLVEGWRFVSRTPVVRGLVVGMLGAFAAGGAVVGLARTYVGDLEAGDPGYAVLFAAVFVGLASGMALGPRLVGGFSRRRLFGLAICSAGVFLGLLGLVPNMVMAVLFTVALGACAGVAWVTGYTLLGLEVADEVRGRTFAFVQTMLRIVLVAVLAVAPLVAAAIGRHTLEFTEARSLTYGGAGLTYVLAALLALTLGVVSYRQMDDRRGVPLVADLLAAVRGEPLRGPGSVTGGYFVAFEGGEGAGKSTQVRLLEEWLIDQGHEVVLTREPGATPLGRRLRELLLDPATGSIAPRAEALLYAADRAEHVQTLITPALERGAIVVTDRYSDSSVAYQGAGRDLPADDIARISRWATRGLVPDLTVVLDIPPEVGLSRGETPADRLEAEPLEFHHRVRQRFLDLAGRHPRRYLVVDATQPPEVVGAQIRERLASVLPNATAPARTSSSPREPRLAMADATVVIPTPAVRHERSAELADEDATTVLPRIPGRDGRPREGRPRDDQPRDDHRIADRPGAGQVNGDVTVKLPWDHR